MLPRFSCVLLLLVLCVPTLGQVRSESASDPRWVDVSDAAIRGVVADGAAPAPAPERARALKPKLQNELGRAREALRANKPEEAANRLETVARSAPNDAELNYLFGVYSAETNNWDKAKSYWQKVLAVQPNHANALLSLGAALVREEKPSDALTYLKRAVEAEPTSWRAHAVLADACLRNGATDEAIEEGERALELGHAEAAVVGPIIAAARESHGDREQALRLLRVYFSGGTEINKPAGNVAAIGLKLEDAKSVKAESLPIEDPILATSLFLSSSWFPADIDDRVPEVEAGVTCDVHKVVEKTGKRIVEFVASVDKFTATEKVVHESFNQWGAGSRPIAFAFDYLVSIEEIRPGFLGVEEYRGAGSAMSKFPDGIATLGLPALVLIFHPYNVVNFDVSCEGMTHLNGKAAWQLYFRQRSDKPNTIRAYRIGENGPSYPVSLKGRAWIAADSYQLLRLETDLIAPLPEIRLAGEYTAIEYGPVRFHSGEKLWVPQSAEVYYNWRGHRTYRRHNFSNYLLFSVEDRQKIEAPQTGVASADSPGPGVPDP